MATYLLFCIAQVPLTTIHRLLETPKHPFLHLVQHPNDTVSDALTESPITPFSTGFEKWTSDKIQQYVSNLTSTEPDGYVLLDGSESDTVIIGHTYSPLFDRDIDTMTPEEREEWEEECTALEDEDPPTEWSEWRVKFEDAERLTTILDYESDFTPKLYNKEFLKEFTDEDGVLLLGKAEERFLELNSGHDEL